MKVLIIDDETKARNVLRTLLIENCSQITQIFEAENLLEGVSKIKELAPKLVFLDIEMPEHSGLEILDFIDKEQFNFEIIFITAYNEYAIHAFKLSAIDYLLKPARPTLLKKAVEKALNTFNNSNIATKLEELKNSFNSSNFNKIGLPNNNGIKFVKLEEIVMLEANGMYTAVTLIDETTTLVSKPLKYFSDLLLVETSSFYKPHRSFIINLLYIKEYIKKDGGYILLENGNNSPISKDKKEEFLKIVQNI